MNSIRPELPNGAGRREGGKMIKVVFKRHYTFRSADNKECAVELVLPADDEGYLVPELRNNKASVFGMGLSKSWGHWEHSTNEDTRYYTKYLFASTWEELDEEVKKLVDESIEVLRRVYKENSEELEKTPADRDEVYILD